MSRNTIISVMFIKTHEILNGFIANIQITRYSYFKHKFIGNDIIQKTLMTTVDLSYFLNLFFIFFSTGVEKTLLDNKELIKTTSGSDLHIPGDNNHVDISNNCKYAPVSYFG